MADLVELLQQLALVLLADLELEVVVEHQVEEELGWFELQHDHPEDVLSAELVAVVLLWVDAVNPNSLLTLVDLLELALAPVRSHS